MTYNRDINHPAPLPTGALPTNDELATLISRARLNQARAIVRSFHRLFGRKPARS